MSDTDKNFDLASFKRANSGMIATSANAYQRNWEKRYSSKLKDYTLEEVEKIINSGSLTEQQKLSRNYYYKDGFYKRLVLHYATLLKYVGLLIPNPSFGKSLSTTHIQKRYFNAVDFIDRANLPIVLPSLFIIGINKYTTNKPNVTEIKILKSASAHSASCSV